MWRALNVNLKQELFAEIISLVRGTKKIKNDSAKNVASWKDRHNPTVFGLALRCELQLFFTHLSKLLSLSW